MSADFIGSIAQEDVKFTTEVVTSTTLGENYSHLVIYAEKDRYIKDSSSFVDIKDSSGEVIASYAEVTDTDYNTLVSGMLLDWLTDYFTAGGVPSVYIVLCSEKLSSASEFDEDAFTLAFNKTQMFGYFKTSCFSADDVTEEPLISGPCVTLAKLCAANDLLSGPVILPYWTATPAAPESDTLYKAITDASTDAFFTCYPVITNSDSTKTYYNKGLVSLALALSVQNSSGTYVGNSFDMVKTTQALASGADNEPLSSTVQSVLKSNNIQYFKCVGLSDNSAAAYGASSIKGKLVPAYWIVAYCNYINKCKVAEYITTRNVFKSQSAYNNILAMLMATIQLFINSGRLTDFLLTAPAYEDLPSSAGDEIIINNAWQAAYTDDLRKVSVTGTLTISA